MNNDLTYISEKPHFYKMREYIISILRSQNVTSNGVSSKRRYMPYAYTEYGFLIIDERECYSLGASLNYIGRKTFVTI